MLPKIEARLIEVINGIDMPEEVEGEGVGEGLGKMGSPQATK